jgi:hypothetical protein
MLICHINLREVDYSLLKRCFFTYAFYFFSEKGLVGKPCLSHGALLLTGHQFK